MFTHAHLSNRSLTSINTHMADDVFSINGKIGRLQNLDKLSLNGKNGRLQNLDKLIVLGPNQDGHNVLGLDNDHIAAGSVVVAITCLPQAFQKHQHLRATVDSGCPKTLHLAD